MSTKAHRIRLPSGREARLTAPRTPERDDVFEGERTLFGRTLRVLARPGALEARGDADAARTDRAAVAPSAWRAIDRDRLLSLPLRDFHALRDLAVRIGAIEPEPDEGGACRNCDAELAIDPRELDPSELAEREHGAPSTVEGTPSPLPSPLRLPHGGIAETIDIRPVSVGEALPLLRALARDEPLRITPRILAAMGIRALGSLERPVLLARVLARASDEVWAAVEQRFLDLAYARSIAPLVCRSCGALHEIELPVPRELAPDVLRRPSQGRDERFPDAEAFEARVERIAPAIYEARKLRNVALRVDTDVPPTDLAGDPLLGAYEPRREVDAAGYTELEFLVTLYYQTFRRLWEEDGPYDLDEEIRETIDHELEHHEHYLEGRDPKDEEERAEARAELRALYGDRRLARLVMREALADVQQFARATWPFFTAVAVALAAASWLGLW
jgi:hypothetical protein